MIKAQAPVYMLNALWFKPEGGAELYQQYLTAAGEVIKELQISAKIMESYIPEEVIIGDLNAWNPDVFFMVEYASEEAFETLINSEAYQQVRPLREAAIEKSLLVRCRAPL